MLTVKSAKFGFLPEILGVSSPTLGEFCFTMMGRADTEGLKLVAIRLAINAMVSYNH